MLRPSFVDQRGKGVQVQCRRKRVPRKKAQRRRESHRESLEVGMPKATCPECHARIQVSEDEANLFAQIECPECGASLEVIEEEPLELESVSDD